MRPLVLVALLLAHLCSAADDAPVLLKAGDPAPVSGVLLPDALALHAAQRQAGCDAERAELRAAVVAQHEGTVAAPLVVVLIVVSVLAGGAITAGGLAAAGKIR